MTQVSKPLKFCMFGIFLSQIKMWIKGRREGRKVRRRERGTEGKEEKNTTVLGEEDYSGLGRDPHVLTSFIP